MTRLALLLLMAPLLIGDDVLELLDGTKVEG